jgi:putative ABC transport system permease protein
MNYLLWAKGLLARSGGRLWSAAVGVALTVALLISLGAFLVDGDSKMTQRAIGDVPVDWQILLSHASDVPKAKEALGTTTSYSALSEVGYADSSAFSAIAGGTTQTTGAGKVLGVEADYFRLFPKQLRTLLGSSNGVLLAQQTATNLHVTVGDQVTIERIGQQAVKVTVNGVVDLPNADSMFQAVGLPKNAAPQAPPDNVIIMPSSQWHQLFDPQRAVRPDTIKMQLHVKIDHLLPNDPSAAYTQVQGLANHVEALIAGNGTIGDNLAARLDGVRQDSLYARILFLFLGLPGVILAALLTLSVAASGEQRRQSQQALLRTRGASLSQTLNFAAIEALIVGVGGVVLGSILAYLTSKFVTGVVLIGNAGLILWVAAAILAGLLLSLLSVLYPAWKQARQSTIAASKLVVGRRGTPLWQRIYVDIMLLIAAAISLWRAASTGYALVLAPEGVAQTSVHYEAFISPSCLWLGGTLLCIRLWSLWLRKGRSTFSKIVRPLSHNLSHVVASSFSRQSRMLVRGIMLTALAFSFASSTAIFNSSYNVQATVDALLTNGSDVRVTGSTAANAGSMLARLQALPGVRTAQSMQHRFAYVGNDLQDLFGIDPTRIDQVTSMSNAYFVSGDAKSVLARLAGQIDGVLVSEETMKDYQLQLGDSLKLRLLGTDHQYHEIPFHFVGVVREFPTAPKDSFLVANADYVAAQTGINAAETVLIRAQNNPGQLAGQIKNVVANLPGVQVSDIGTIQSTISSSLTSVNLKGLTRLELMFAIIFIAATTGLVLALGLNERRRTHAILSALGANRKQLGAFLWSEGLLVMIGGGIVGLLLGVGLSELLVKVLTGVFDPPPEFLHVPWIYLAALIVTGIVSTVVAVWVSIALCRRATVQSLRS